MKLLRSAVSQPGLLLHNPCTEVWGASFHRDYMLASDMNSGLWVFRLK